MLVDKDYIIREPNYEYVSREIQWYESQSLNVNDIPGNVPAIWKQCADVNGDINSNYGWMIFSKENGSQYKNCLWSLVNDPSTRQGVMIYTRPEMQQDWNKNHKYDFCCTFAVQYFLNPVDDKYELNTFVLMRSNDARNAQKQNPYINQRIYFQSSHPLIPMCTHQNDQIGKDQQYCEYQKDSPHIIQNTYPHHLDKRDKKKDTEIDSQKQSNLPRLIDPTNLIRQTWLHRKMNDIGTKFLATLCYLFGR